MPVLTEIGGYRVREAVGRGGMATVYRACAPDGAEVAIKRLDPALAPGASARFLREARMRFDHPNVVHTRGAGYDDDGAPYLVLELLEGQTLAEELARGPLGPERAIEVARHVAAALTAVHARGVVHRDVKPSNVFCCRDGAVKLIDFGVAAVIAGAAPSLTAPGKVLGSPSYLAPEQARGEPNLDARADLWSLGVLLFEALTGRKPFERPGALATMLAVVTERAPRLDEVAPGLPPALADVVARCLEPDRERRWPSAAALRDALGAIESTATEVAPAARPRANEARDCVVRLGAGFAAPRGRRRHRRSRGDRACVDALEPRRGRRGVTGCPARSRDPPRADGARTRERPVITIGL